MMMILKKMVTDAGDRFFNFPKLRSLRVQTRALGLSWPLGYVVFQSAYDPTI